MDRRPEGGVHYPKSMGDLLAWFGTDADCLDYLDWLRWPNGFVCPDCGGSVGWMLDDGRYRCRACRKRISVTAGTIFDHRRTPLTVWFVACWLFATQKDGMSALSLKRELAMGSYQTAWAMLHRLRSVLVRPGRDRLCGLVEVDEFYIGGEEPGLRGRAKGKKVLVGVAVERKQPKGFGRCRMAILADASAESLSAFLRDHVEEGSTITTDGWVPYISAIADKYTHQRHVVPQRLAHKVLPGVHRAASLVKRWILGTHQGSIDEAHLPNYLNEFVFRFNRRPSRNQGMVFFRLLELAVGHEPVRYRDIRLNPEPKPRPPTPPTGRGKPPSLDRPRASRPWRSASRRPIAQ